MAKKTNIRDSQSGWKRFKRAALEIIKDLEQIVRQVLFLVLTLATTLLIIRLVLISEIVKNVCLLQSSLVRLAERS